MKILIINSHGHWLNGWASFPETQIHVINALEKAGCQVEIVEVHSPEQLDSVLQNTQKDTLVWANAYWVNDGRGGEVGLIKQIEHYQLRMVGPNLETLNLLLEKDRCQQQLEVAGIPVPQHIIFQNKGLSDVREQLKQWQPTFPLVIKPTKESRSHGVTKVETIDEAVRTIHHIGEKYPHGNIIVEEFLPTDDITCGYIKLGHEFLILPSLNVVKGMDCSKEVFSEAHYLLPPSHEKQVLISDINILNQLQAHLPNIVNTLSIPGFTRIDARLDNNGVLKFFDINGMPGLNYPISAIIKQCFVHFPGYSKKYLFECLINTIVLERFQQYNLPAPAFMQEHHLFNLESDTIIKTSEFQGIQKVGKPFPKKLESILSVKKVQ